MNAAGEDVPRIFISYSHDSRAHKQWVAELGARLRKNAIDAILDQWDLSPGDDVARFMEEGLTSADRVLVVCTPAYVRKADAGEGGVGYEKMIVTAELVRNLGTKKFIPVIARGNDERLVPTFLRTRFHVDLSKEADFGAQFDLLLHDLHEVPITQKPPLGPNPFARLASGQEAPAAGDQGVEPLAIPDELGDPLGAYHTAVALARRGDLLGWRQFVRQIQAPVSAALASWRRKNEGVGQWDWESVCKAVDEAVYAAAGLFVVGLVGVQSEKEQLRDQRSLLDDVVNLLGWNYGGLVVLAEAPLTLGYVYHSLHGAMSVATGQFGLAMALADMKIRVSGWQKHLPVWQHDQLVGWPDSLGGSCTKAWKYLSEGAERWPWASKVFGSPADCRIGLVSYYMALNVHELAARLVQAGGKDGDAMAEARLSVPLCFASEGREINARAVTRLSACGDAMERVWASLGVDRRAIEAAWPKWLQVCQNWLDEVYHLNEGVPHRDLFDVV